MKKQKYIYLLIITGALVALSVLPSCKDDEELTSEVAVSELLKTNTDISLTKNPHGIAPLSAELSFETKLEVRVDLEIKGSLPVYQSWSTYSTSHTIPVLGLYPGCENEISLTMTCDDGRYAQENFMITTDSLPDYFPQIGIETYQDGMSEDGMILNTMVYAESDNSRLEPFMFDKNGNVRWWMDLSELNGNGSTVNRLKNGNLVVLDGNRVLEYSMTGEKVKDLSVPGYDFKHGIIELPYDNLACIATKNGATIVHNDAEVTSYKDHFVEIQSNSGDIIQEWNLQDVLDVNREIMAYTSGDWLHLNSIEYRLYDDTYVLSGRHQGVVKVGRNNDLRWILAPHYNWGDAGHDGTGISTEPFLLTAVDASGQPYGEDIQHGNHAASDFDWPWGQHASTLLDNGNLLLFDNGYNRHFENSEPTHSRAVEYKIEESDTTVQQVWQYGSARGAEFYSAFGGDVNLLDNGNRLITSGTVNHNNQHYAVIVEVSYPDNMEVFEAKVYFQDLEAENDGTPESSDMIYRAEKISLYPETE
ncbi:MAG: aryl-sulfate sulfotransferase [Bacteroidales bacterium]